MISGTSKLFQWVNRGKRTIQLDLKVSQAREFIHRVVRGMDVVVINYGPGVPKRLGIDYETLSAINPRLIHATISGLGPEGSMSEDAGADMTAQAYSGAIAANGKVNASGAPELISGISLGDTAAGIGAAMGVCAALYHRAMTGEGQYVESSLVLGAMAVEGATSMRDGATDAVGRDRSSSSTPKSARVAVPTRSCSMRGRRAPRHAEGQTSGAATTRRTAPSPSPRTPAPGGNASGRSSASRGWATMIQRWTSAPRISRRSATVSVSMEAIFQTRAVQEWVRMFRAAGAPVAPPVLLPEEVADDEQGRYYYHEQVHSGRDQNAK